MTDVASIACDFAGQKRTKNREGSRGPEVKRVGFLLEKNGSRFLACIKKTIIFIEVGSP